MEMEEPLADSKEDLEYQLILLGHAKTTCYAYLKLPVRVLHGMHTHTQWLMALPTGVRGDDHSPNVRSIP
jgi:hypothetical protein